MLFPLLAARGFRGVIDTFTGSGNLSDRIPDQGNRPWVSATGTISSNAARHTETLGAELATGNLVVGSIYQITATQADYFFTGCAINDYFQATATTALDANNKVKLLTQSTIETTANLGFSNGRYWATPGTVGTGEIVGQIILSDGNNNFVRAVYSEGTGKLLVTKSVAGTFTTLINTAITYSAGAKLCLVHDKSEGKIWAFYNNASIGTAQALTDASIINNAWHGILTTGTATITAVDFGPLGYGAELITDGGMEAWNDATTLTYWSHYIAGGSTLSRSTDKKAGTYAALLTSAVDGSVDINQAISYIPGELYRVIIPIKLQTGITPIIKAYTYTGGELTSGFSIVGVITGSVYYNFAYAYFIALAADDFLKISRSSDDAVYSWTVDDLSMKQVQ